MAKKDGKKSGALRLSSIFLRGFLLLFVGAVAVAVGNQATRYQRLQEEQAAIQSEIEAEQARKIEFEQQQKYYNSDAYIEQMARDNLGMIKPNEILYINRSE